MYLKTWQLVQLAHLYDETSTKYHILITVTFLGLNKLVQSFFSFWLYEVYQRGSTMHDLYTPLVWAIEEMWTVGTEVSLLKIMQLNENSSFNLWAW